MNKSGQDIKNMMYKTKYMKEDLQSVSETLEAKIKKNNDNLDLFLEKDRDKIKKETWTRLDKTIKIQKIDEYVDSIVEKNNLSCDEVNSLKYYLSGSIERKRLLSVKEVLYDKNTGKIKSIPCLSFNTSTRTFTLKRCEKRVSTLKSLGDGKKKVVIYSNSEDFKEED